MGEDAAQQSARPHGVGELAPPYKELSKKFYERTLPKNAFLNEKQFVSVLISFEKIYEKIRPQNPIHLALGSAVQWIMVSGRCAHPCLSFHWDF